MLCRRCGMESSTTDICEWCKRPMLPAGAQVTGQAKTPSKEVLEAIAQEPPGRSLGEVTAGDQEEEEPESAQGSHEEEMELRPLGGDHARPPQGRAPAQPPPTTAAAPPDTAEPEAPAPAEPASSAPTMPSHGLADDATKTSIDISQYMGDDESIFRPIVREQPQAEDTRDLLAQRHRRRLEEARGPEIPENTRLMRCLIAGLVVAVPAALIQYLITGDTVTVLFTSVPLSRSASLVAALKYGLASGIILGFGIGALLVRLKKGPGLGFIVGILVGALALGNHLWSIVPGAVVGIYAGRVATFGIRRVINV